MMDFSSALYLGLRHPAEELMPWKAFSLGKPAALAVSPIQRQVERSLARLQGCERAVLGSSTLHLFCDLLPLLDGHGMRLFFDSGVYPIAQWGVRMAQTADAKIRRFDHFDPWALDRCLKKRHDRHLNPVVVTNGFCPGCGCSAPMKEFLQVVRHWGGLLVLDDTQALGIHGYHPGPGQPYGRGGGGSLARHGVCGNDIVLVCSLAKGLGVPVAALSGSRNFVEWFEANSLTRMHCSPPSLPAVHAAAHALKINARCGDHLRQRLAGLVGRFRVGLNAIGISFSPGLFPVQTIQPPSGLDAAEIYEQLLRRGIRTVLHQARQQSPAMISFLITARHRIEDIDNVIDALAAIIYHQRTEVQRERYHDLRTNVGR